MTFPVKAVIFDWAGTMVDFGCKAPVKALCDVFAGEGVPITEAEARADMGKAKYDHVTALLNEPAIAARWAARFGTAPTGADIDRVYANVEQGYTPDVVICAGDTPSGRPAPHMAWAALIALDVWPAGAAIKVDDAPVGIAEGRNAGCWTIGVAASGNAVGLDAAELAALDPATRDARIAAARAALLAEGADAVIDDVSHLLPVVHRIAAAIAAGASPGSGLA